MSWEGQIMLKTRIGNMRATFEDDFLVSLCFTTQDRSKNSFVIPAKDFGELSRTAGIQKKENIQNRMDPCRRHLASTGMTNVSLVINQLRDYFSGRLKTFDVPLKLQGTDFQKSVWKALRRIPYGQTRSYAEIAQMINRPRAVRTVATAVANNPIAIIIPCHRVIRSDGSLGQFAWGIERKKVLLKLEGFEIES